MFCFVVVVYCDNGCLLRTEPVCVALLVQGMVSVIWQWKNITRSAEYRFTVLNKATELV
jgi:hypothetical protein